MPMNLFGGLAMSARPCFFSDCIARRCLGIALIIGTILTLINQGGN